MTLVALLAVLAGLTFGGGEKLISLLGNRSNEKRGRGDEGDTKAIEIFEKIQEVLEKAKTISVRFTSSVKPAGGAPFNGSGSLLLKDGDRGNLTYTFENPRGKHRLRLISDGSLMKYTFEIPGEIPKIVHEETPRPLIHDLGLVRYGLFTGIFRYSGLLDIYPRGGQLDHFARGSLHLADFKWSAGERGRDLVTYTIVEDGHDRNRVELWYDSRTMKPIKRDIHGKFLPIGCGSKGETETESHEEFTLDSGIANEMFALPAERPDPAVYRATDIGEPKGLELKSAKDVRLVGWLERGLLEYEGLGELESVFQDYVSGMKAREWTILSQKVDGTTGECTMRRYMRVCSVAFSKVGDRLQATLKISPSK